LWKFTKEKTQIIIWAAVRAAKYLGHVNPQDMLNKISLFIVLAAILGLAPSRSPATAGNVSVQLSQSSADLNTIGVIRDLRSAGFSTPPAQQRVRVNIRDAVFRDELIETVVNVAMRIRFSDATSLRIGSESLVLLDEFIYDPDGDGSAMILILTKGVFRFVSGKINKQAYQIITPAALIGVRGTDFLETVTVDSTVVDVCEGEIDFEPRGGDGDNVQAVAVTASQSVSVSTQSNSPTLGTAAPPSDPVLAGEVPDDEDDVTPAPAADDDADDDDDHHGDDDDDHGDEGGGDD
jgi:hypothetical protein